MQRSVASRALSALSAVAVWGYAALLLLPLYYLLVSSSKSNTEIFSSGIALPTTWTFDNFVTAWETAALGRGLVNSVYVVAVSLTITLVLAVPASYVIARSRGWFGSVVEKFFSLGFLIPGFAALVPTVIVAVWLRMFQTKEYVALFLAATALPLAVVLITQYMRAIPSALEESAMIDGASRFRILKEIYIPLAWPGITSVAVLNFVNFWNEYLFTLVLGGPTVAERTVQVALPNLAGTRVVDYGLISAGTIITLIPVVVFYVIVNKRLVGAMSAGAVKG